MKVVRAILNAILATVGGSLAGGAAGGVTFALALHLPDPSNAISIPAAAGGIAIYVMGVFFMAYLGLAGGLIFGFIPTLIVGTTLSILRDLTPFRSLLVWAMVGLLAGIIVHNWLGSGTGPSRSPRQELAWTLAWAAGGAVSMTIYWLAAVGGRQKQGEVTPSAPVR